jgi:hypothetical protein
VYVVKVPLTTHYIFDVYRVIPFPMKAKDTINKFTFIQPEKEYIVRHYETILRKVTTQ